MRRSWPAEISSSVAELAVRVVVRDDLPTRQGRCPKCGTWQDIDPDQDRGEVSSLCSACDWHETIRWDEIPILGSEVLE